MIKENDCNFSPCLNGATCTSVNDADTRYNCACTSGCTGKNCSTCSNGCSTFGCQNNANCLINTGNGQPYCVCQNGYNGVKCENCK